MDRKRAVRRVGVVVLAANLLLVAVKAGAWWHTGSLAVGSEAVNSLADVAYSLVVLGGLYLTTQPPDFEHPHGHERIEPFVSLVVAVGVLAAGAGVLWSATNAVLQGSYGRSTSLVAVGVLAGTAVGKFVLYRYCLDVAEERRSPAVRATALDNRNDILTASAALVGVLGSAVGLPVLDPLAAFVVAGGILYTGYEIIQDNVNYLVGAAPDDALREEILSRALAHPDVHGAHDVVAHYVGPEVDVSLHIEVEGDMTLRNAHDIETAIVMDIRSIPEVDDVFVHIDPRELGEWATEEDRNDEATPEEDGNNEAAPGDDGNDEAALEE